MYEVFKSVITSGNYELSDILTKIDTIWVQGQITDEQRTELVELARQNADPEQSYAPLQRQINALFVNMAEISVQVSENTANIKAIKDKLAEQGTEVPEPEPEPEEEYPAWKQPTNATDAYYKDNKMTYTDGKKYICIAPDGYAVTYGPDVLPDMWQLVEESKEEPGEPEVEPTE